MGNGSRNLSLSEVCVINYGLGNLRSVENALRAVGAYARVVKTPKEVASADRLILPGVGSFNEGMRNLRDSGLAEAICSAAQGGTPLLGICLGMQLLASHGEEGGDSQGLGLIPGRVKRFEIDVDLRIPHMGFNEVFHRKRSPLFEAVADGSDFYFVHSYHLMVDDLNDSLARANYGRPFVAAVHRANVFGTQFHPEKSQSQGLQLLKNFCSLA
jgi:glutamine amidotransferase